MSITVAEALESLNAMFPTYDKETLLTLLQANKNNVERTVETIFLMESGGDVTLPAAQQRPQQQMQPSQQQQRQQHPSRPSAYSDTTAPSPYDDIMFDTPPYPRNPRQSTAGSGVAHRAAADSRDPQSSHHATHTPQRRRIELPEDFLRPPGWRDNNVTLADEQLAMMLQVG